MVGHVITTPNKFAGPNGPSHIHTNVVSEGLRKAVNLCHGCEKYKPDRPDNCPIANRLFTLGREQTIATIVTRCGYFVERKERKDADHQG